MIKYTSDEVEALLRFQNRRLVTALFTRMLALIENLEREHEDALEKLHRALPEEYKAYVNLANYWTDTRADLFRKMILDDGNNTIRALDEMLANYDITLKQ